MKLKQRIPFERMKTGKERLEGSIERDFVAAVALRHVAGQIASEM